jgi:hypothetical protein
MKVRYWIATSKYGSECRDTLEFEDGEWEAMTDDEQEEVMKEAAFNHLEWGFKVVDSVSDSAP